jgi:hypothetical protein
MKQLAMFVGAFGVVAMMMACAANDDGSASASSASTANEPGAPSRTGGTSRGRPVVNKEVDSGTSTATDGGADAGPLGCYANQGTCEPTNPTACDKGQACDINGQTRAFECFDPPNDAHLGDACNNGSGPFCAHGLACHQGFCATYCCDDSACAAGTHCTETGTVGTIHIKVCQ